MGVEVKNLNKEFFSQDGVHAAVRDVSFSVDEGSLVALLGPSGSGKSTILRMIAGLEQPDSGEIYLSGESVTHLAPQKRGVGFVFQNYALFKQMTVFDNIAFGLELQKIPRQKIRGRVQELLELLGLGDLGDRYSHQLSGGQRQRVALARALAPSPKVLLLDEPFGAIDAKIRQELREWLRKLHDDLHVTSLFVTHDQEEAMEICDQIFVINRGRIEQGGKPEEIYNHPATEFVANFVGSMNIIPGKVENGKVPMGPYAFPVEHMNGFREGDEIKVFFRPQDIYISGDLGAYALHGTIVRTSFLGVNMKMEVVGENGMKFTAVVPQHIFAKEQLQQGKSVSYQIEELSYVNMREGQEIKKLAVADYEI
jgi:sulfate transport system ATP-binding protein